MNVKVGGSRLIGMTIGGYILTLISGCAAGGLSGLRGTGDVPTVTYCDLTARPEFYDNKVVRIRAILDNNFEQRYLYDVVCKLGEAPRTAAQTPPETWVDFDPLLDFKGESEQAKTNRKITGFGRVDITAIGKFQTSRGGVKFGHMGCCRHLFVVKKVEAAVFSGGK